MLLSNYKIHSSCHIKIDWLVVIFLGINKLLYQEYQFIVLIWCQWFALYEYMSHYITFVSGIARRTKKKDTTVNEITKYMKLITPNEELKKIEAICAAIAAITKYITEDIDTRTPKYK